MEQIIMYLWLYLKKKKKKKNLKNINSPTRTLLHKPEEFHKRPGTVVHGCNPGYLGGRGRRIAMTD
jgi:hypothetical protein